MLIIKLDLLQVAGGKTNSHCRHQTDNALQLTFVFSITCGLGNEKRMVDVTLPHRHTHMHAHSVNRVLTRFKTMTTNSECGFLPVVYGLDFTVRLLSCFCLQPHLTLLSHVWHVTVAIIREHICECVCGRQIMTHKFTEISLILAKLSLQRI